MGFIDNIKNILVIPPEEPEENSAEIIEEEEVETPVAEAPKTRPEPRILRSKTVSYKSSAENTTGGMQVVLVKPTDFGEVRSIADHLNTGKTVVLNLEDANAENSRRIVDFLGGAAYANNGIVKKVAKHTFIIAAKGVDVMGELLLDEIDDNGLYF